MTALSDAIYCTCGASGAADGHHYTCPIRSGISPAEAARRQAARKRQQTEAYFAELAGDEERYREVRDFLTPEDREHIATLRQRRLDGDESAYFGHDLRGAISRGLANKATAKARELLALQRQRGGGTDEHRLSRFAFSMGMHSMIDAAAQTGLTAEEIRSVLQRELDCNDSTRIEKRVEKHHPDHPLAPPRHER